MGSPLSLNKGQLSTRSNRGSIIIFVVLMMPILLGIMGIAIDMGRLFVVKSELQNAADACALAAAYELDGTASQFTRAETAGITLATINRTLFQKEAVAATADTSVEFSTTDTGGYASKGGAAANAAFARCTLARNNIANSFIQLLGLGDQDMSATAVATNLPGQTTCSLPIALCSDELTATTPVGTWLSGKQSAQGGEEGFFRWVDFSPPAGGASELHGLLSGANQCNINVADPNVPIAEYGNINSGGPHYNTRFGIRAGGASSGVPDLSGYAYYPTNFPAAFNAYPDFVSNRRPVNAPFQGVSGINLSGNPTVLTAAQLAAQGTSRRVSVAPVINCETKVIESYACVFLLHPMNTQGNPNFEMYLEFLGDANATGPCKSFAFAGSSTGNGPLVSSLVQ
ncbi:MAG: pilus assembly protein TadG-related protein [Pseudomonadota bacterium]